MRVFRYLYGFTTPPNFRSPFHIMKTTKKAPNLAGRGLRVLLTSKGNYETSTCIVGRVFQQGGNRHEVFLADTLDLDPHGTEAHALHYFPSVYRMADSRIVPTVHQLKLEDTSDPFIHRPVIHPVPRVDWLLKDSLVTDFVYQPVVCGCYGFELIHGDAPCLKVSP